MKNFLRISEFFKWLKLAGFQFLAKVFHLPFDRNVGFQFALNNANGVQGGGMITVEAFSDYLQGRIGIPAGQIHGDLPGADNGLFP